MRYTIVSAIFVSLGAGSAAAQDTVIVASASDPAARITKEGIILDYTGKELRLRTPLGTNEVIPASRVIEVRTTWTDPHRAGRKAQEGGRLEEAIRSLQSAKSEETRPWARRQISAELAGCYLEAENIASAGDGFLSIVASDPESRHYDVIPVAWRGMAISGPSASRAAEWLAMKPAAARLLGASWLLAGPRRSAAESTLEGLSSSSDPRIAALATIQLWRTRWISATPAEVDSWRERLEQMPVEVQAAGWYVVGEVLSRQNRADQAAIAYLKVPLLFRQQRAMAADALLAAGQQLEKMSQTEQATRLYREFIQDFEHRPAADEAKRRLAAIEKATKGSSDATPPER